MIGFKRGMFILVILASCNNGPNVVESYVDRHCKYNGNGQAPFCAPGEGQEGAFNDLAKAMKVIEGEKKKEL